MPHGNQGSDSMHAGRERERERERKRKRGKEAKERERERERECLIGGEKLTYL
jgi:hypothetical protein